MDAMQQRAGKWRAVSYPALLPRGGHGQDGGGVGDAGGERHGGAAADEVGARRPGLRPPDEGAPRGLRHSDGSLGVPSSSPPSEPGSGACAGEGPSGAGRGERSGTTTVMGTLSSIARPDKEQSDKEGAERHQRDKERALGLAPRLARP